MIQTIIILLIFAAASSYLIWLVRKQFVSKDAGCTKGCGCSAVDLEKIEKEIASKSLSK